MPAVQAEKDACPSKQHTSCCGAEHSPDSKGIVALEVQCRVHVCDGLVVVVAFGLGGQQGASVRGKDIEEDATQPKHARAQHPQVCCGWTWGTHVVSRQGVCGGRARGYSQLHPLNNATITKMRKEGPMLDADTRQSKLRDGQGQNKLPRLPSVVSFTEKDTGRYSLQLLSEQGALQVHWFSEILVSKTAQPGSTAVQSKLELEQSTDGQCPARMIGS